MQVLIAGFGGQGVLFIGKVLAYSGLIREKQVSWLPSYGPEMRGGTANCNVIISDTPIGSPIITNPDCLIAMNLPSFEKYQNSVVPGGTIILDSTLIDAEVTRTDVKVFRVPATKIASEQGLNGLANMILAGTFFRSSCPEAMDSLEAALGKTIPPKKKDLFEPNRKAVEIGFAYQQ